MQFHLDHHRMFQASPSIQQPLCCNGELLDLKIENGVIRHYIINVTELETGSEFGAITIQMAITFSLLHPYYTYVCTVYAVSVGAGPGAEPVSVITMEDSKYSFSIESQSVLWCTQNNN